VFAFALICFTVLSGNFRPYAEYMEGRPGRVEFRVANDPEVRPNIEELAKAGLPSSVQNFCVRCWDHLPEDRPSFDTIVAGWSRYFRISTKAGALEVGGKVVYLRSGRETDEDAEDFVLKKETFSELRLCAQAKFKTKKFSLWFVSDEYEVEGEEEMIVDDADVQRLPSDAMIVVKTGTVDRSSLLLSRDKVQQQKKKKVPLAAMRKKKKKRVRRKKPAKDSHSAEEMVRFDAVRASKEISVTEEGAIATKRVKKGKKDASALAVMGYTSGMHSWTVEITSGDVMIGIADGDHHLSKKFVGQTATSWGVSCGRAWKVHDNNVEDYGKKFKTGDRIGVELDLDKGTLKFKCNGEDLGVAFDEGLRWNGLRLFPAVSFSAKGQSCKFVVTK